jgi:hypothetical protein
MKLNVEKLKQGGILKAQEGGGFINKLIKSKEYNSPLATALKIIDPTGVSSYGDVYNAWTDGKFDYNDIIEPLGTVPVFGKLGKVGKFALKGIKGIEDFNNAKKIIKASKFVNSDVIKTRGRTFKTSFNKTFVSPYTFQEYQSAKKFIKGNPLLNYSQYGIKTIAGLDDILDIKNQGKDFLISLQNKSIKKQKGGLLYPKVNQLINRTNQKNIDFINRLKDPNRKFITNWENQNQIATHKMSWATDDKGATIYPNVQNIKGKLIDFTRPPYNKWAGYNSAIQNNDTIQATPEVAQEYTTNYKKFYPQFNK